MSGFGVAMFLVAIVAIVVTRLPVYAVLLGTGAAFAAFGVAIGAFPWSILGALPDRIVGLLEHDLLQALPLYAFIGALLNRLPLATELHRAGERLFARSGAASSLSALGVGALLAPMNGSVGASLSMLSRRIAPALAARGVAPAETAATLCVASTLGVVIPPSLVLLLLGDAMMRAHTEALNASHATTRIINTQDVVRAGIVPGAMVLVAALAIAAWRGRARMPAAATPASRATLLEALGVALVIAALLGAVAIGRLYAVEAAATGALALLAWALLSRQLDAATWRAVLADAMTLTGLLIALLVAATSFSLVLRAFATDALVADALAALAPRPALLLGTVMLALIACSFVLDAFEMIFLVIPIVMPPVLVALPDAAWVAVVTLLVLQAGFLIPPLGYAIVMARRVLPDPPALAALARSLAPQLAAQALVLAILMAWPACVHWGDTPERTAPDLSVEEVERLMQGTPRATPPP